MAAVLSPRIAVPREMLTVANMPTLRDCVVLHGPDLHPHHCQDFSWQQDTIERLDLGEPCPQLSSGTRVILPGLYNGHTHVGDSALPDGAAGLTLEQGFFRPDGYKYRELAKLDPDRHRQHVQDALQFMARTGTVGHLDFREQGVSGAELLREVSETTGIHSVILSQFDHSPQTGTDLEKADTSLPSTALQELESICQVADGFSESTMNDLSDAAWRQIRSVTKQHGKLRAIHCLENSGYRELSLQRTGRGDLVRALDLLAPELVVHLTAANEAEIHALVASGTTAALNPRANATLGLTLPPVLALLDAGANLLLGTDNVMLNPPNLWAELDFTYRLVRSQAGEGRPADPSPQELLKMVTTNIAGVIGEDHGRGLAVGAPATFVVVDFSALHLRHTRNLLTSLVSRVTPADVLATYRLGRELWCRPGEVVDDNR